MLAPETIAWLHEQIWRLARHAGFLTGGEAVRRMLPRRCGTLLVTGGLVDVDSVATAYRTLHTKPRDGWTNKLDLRPSVERW